jgi:hypothetical protein
MYDDMREKKGHECPNSCSRGNDIKNRFQDADRDDWKT